MATEVIKQVEVMEAKGTGEKDASQSKVEVTNEERGAKPKYDKREQLYKYMDSEEAKSDSSIVSNLGVRKSEGKKEQLVFLAVD